MKNRLKNFSKYLFSIDTNSTSRSVIYFLGIKFRHLKRSAKTFAQEYTNLSCPITDIPQAKGTLRKIQLANLKLLEIFDKLCKENNLEYWLDFGNLLGAIRHKGFIPWDDDIDVSMARPDYEKFIKHFREFSSPDNNLYITFDNNGINRCFIKLLHSEISSIGIDIFPYDFYYKHVREDEKLTLSNELKRLQNIKRYRFLKLLFINLPQAMRKRFKKLTKKSILNNKNPNVLDKPSLFYGIDFPHRHKNKVFDYEDIFPLKTISFEGIDFPCPNKSEKVLAQLFGDYMKLPSDCYPRHSNSFSKDEDFIKQLDNFIGEDL